LSRQAIGVRRPKNHRASLSDLAHRGALTVCVADPEGREQEPVALLAADDHVLKPVPGGQKAAKLVAVLERQLRDEIFNVDGAAVHVLRSEERSVLLEDVGTNFNGWPGHRAPPVVMMQGGHYKTKVVQE
jgi:hypothetical protein